jgi:hypothetical protein
MRPARCVTLGCRTRIMSSGASLILAIEGLRLVAEESRRGARDKQSSQWACVKQRGELASDDQPNTRFNHIDTRSFASCWPSHDGGFGLFEEPPLKAVSARPPQNCVPEMLVAYPIRVRSALLDRHADRLASRAKCAPHRSWLRKRV